MQRNKIISLLVIGTLSIVAVAGFITYRTVFAQSPSATPSTAALPFAGEDFRGGRGGMHEGASEQDFATALGIDLAKLQEAQKTATADALKEAVAKGLITQAQADAFSTNNFHGGFPGGMGWLTQNGIDYNALLAKALGISTDELQAARQKAVTIGIDRAVSEGKLTQEQADLMKGRSALYANEKFQSSMQAAFEAGVQQAVKDGVITQAQADLILKEGNGLKDRGGFGGPGFGRHGR